MRKFFLMLFVTLLVINRSNAQSESLQENTIRNSGGTLFSSAKSEKVLQRGEYVNLQTAATLTSSGPLSAIYTFPDGYYYLGLDVSHSEFSETSAYAFGPAYYRGSVWKNLSSNADSYKWFYSTVSLDVEGMGEVEWEISEEAEPDIIYPFGTFHMPTLYAMTDEKDTVAYRWGASNGYLWAGGATSVISGGQKYDFGATNLDHFFFGVNITSLSPTSYAFGSNQYGVSSVYELFSKPVTTYLLDQIRIGLGTLIIPAGSEFNLIVHRFEDGEPRDTIATATWISPQAYYLDQEEGYSYLGFNEFDVEIDGVKSKTNRLEINEAILIEFTGFNSSPDITLAIGDQVIESFDGKSTAYVGIETSEGKVLKRTDEVYSLNEVPLKTSLAFMLDMIYPWLVLGKEVVELPLSGDAQVVKFNSFFEEGKEDGYLTFENVPEWLTIEVLEYELDADYIVKVAFKAKETEENRQAEIIARTPGCSLNFVVKQDASINNIILEKAGNIEVIMNEYSIDITFDGKFKTLSLYDISGKKLNEFYLSGEQKVTLPIYGLDKGVYILNFDGETSETIKIVK